MEYFCLLTRPIHVHPEGPMHLRTSECGPTKNCTLRLKKKKYEVVVIVLTPSPSSSSSSLELNSIVLEHGISCGWSHCITMSKSLKQSESPASHPVLESNSGSHGFALVSVTPLNLTLKYIPYSKVLERCPLNQSIRFEDACFGI